MASTSSRSPTSIRSCGSRSRCRRNDVDIDPETLELLDTNKDGRIRVAGHPRRRSPRSSAAFKNPSELLTSRGRGLAGRRSATRRSSPRRSACSPTSARRTSTAISVDDTDAVTKAFADTVLNGDGIVIPASADDAGVRTAIEDAIATVGSVTDRSGKPGIDQGARRAFFADVDGARRVARRRPRRSRSTSAAADALRRGARQARGLLHALPARRVRRPRAGRARRPPKPSSPRSRRSSSPPATTRSRRCRSRRSSPPPACRCAPRRQPGVGRPRSPRSPRRP